MNKKEIRHSRILWLTNSAKSGKYTWKDLKEMARKFGISEPTVREYMDEVHNRLVKAGLLKEEPPK